MLNKFMFHRSPSLASCPVIFAFWMQSALLLLNHFLGPCFNEFVYERLGDIMDFLTLINNSINFLLYCGMSKQFRDTFLSLFCSSLPLSGPILQPHDLWALSGTHIRTSVHTHTQTHVHPHPIRTPVSMRDHLSAFRCCPIVICGPRRLQMRQTIDCFQHISRRKEEQRRKQIKNCCGMKNKANKICYNIHIYLCSAIVYK